MSRTMQNCFSDIRGWSSALIEAAKDAEPIVESTLFSEERGLPYGCPSKGSMAMMELRPMEQCIQEICGAYNDLQQAIADQDQKKNR